jgi:hypothetical protein
MMDTLPGADERHKFNAREGRSATDDWWRDGVGLCRVVRRQAAARDETISAPEPRGQAETARAK